jgi:hypothetical protein
MPPLLEAPLPLLLSTGLTRKPWQSLRTSRTRPVQRSRLCSAAAPFSVSCAKRQADPDRLNLDRACPTRPPPPLLEAPLPLLLSTGLTRKPWQSLRTSRTRPVQIQTIRIGLPLRGVASREPPISLDGSFPARPEPRPTRLLPTHSQPEEEEAESNACPFRLVRLRLRLRV